MVQRIENNGDGDACFAKVVMSRLQRYFISGTFLALTETLPGLKLSAFPREALGSRLKEAAMWNQY